MPSTKLLGAMALTASLAGGGVVGALFGAPVVSLAQESTDEPTATAECRHHPRLHRFGRGGRGAVLEVSAETIGISEDELRQALRDGQSIADVAEERGVDSQAVVDALVANANERIDEMQENLPDRFTDLVNRERG